MKIIFYYDSRSLNDATSYYVYLVEKSLEAIGLRMVYQTNLKDVNREDVIFTITSKFFLKGKLRFPRNRTIFWAQGIAPEESLLFGQGKIKYIIKRIIENISVTYCDFLFLVSKKMLIHFKSVYNYSKEDYLIIPCYNLNYERGLVEKTKDRYESPNFVYAGSMSVWQCIDETLQIFGQIQKKITNATLTLLVKEYDIAQELIKKYKLNNVIVKYVDLNILQNELRKYKYGFIIREDNIVNNVATPTKMNSYLASGIIPIFTDAVDAFVENIKKEGYSPICLSSASSIEDKANSVLKFENKDFLLSKYEVYLDAVFNNYYNDEKYKEEIVEGLKKRFNL